MSEKHQKYPGPLYAAAGVSDLAAEKLRTVPDRVAGLSEWARGELSGGRGRAREELAELGGRIGAGLASWRNRAQHLGTSLSDADLRTDLRRFQQGARRRAGELANAAARNLATAQGRAAHVYDDLVARGTAVLDGTDAEVTGTAEPAELTDTAAPVPEPVPEPAPEPVAGEERPAKKMAKKATRPVSRRPASKE